MRCAPPAVAIRRHFERPKSSDSVEKESDREFIEDCNWWLATAEPETLSSNVALELKSQLKRLQWNLVDPGVYKTLTEHPILAPGLFQTPH
jgi:hypothetical protein